MPAEGRTTQLLRVALDASVRCMPRALRADLIARPHFPFRRCIAAAPLPTLPLSPQLMRIALDAC